MPPTRRQVVARRRIVAAAVAAVLALIVVVLVQPSGPKHPGRSTRAVASARRPTSTPSAPASQPPYAIGTVTRSVRARTSAGVAVSVGVTVYYPALGPAQQVVGAGATPLGHPAPLVVFSPGYQIAPTSYDPLLEAWAADGDVVAVATYPDTAPGAPAIETDMTNHPSELSQVISDLEAASAGPGRLHHLVRASEVAVAGQSDGGDVSWAAADDTCCRDPRIKAAIILSGAEQTLFGGAYEPRGAPPLLVAQGTADVVNAPACSQALFDGAPDPRYYLNLLGASHLSAYTTPGAGLDAVKATTEAFLHAYLGGGSSGQAIVVAGDRPGVSSVTVGPATVPVAGECLGAPAG